VEIGEGRYNICRLSLGGVSVMFFLHGSGNEFEEPILFSSHLAEASYKIVELSAKYLKVHYGYMHYITSQERHSSCSLNIENRQSLNKSNSIHRTSLLQTKLTTTTQASLHKQGGLSDHQ
jgi:hypothetical protein